MVRRVILSVAMLVLTWQLKAGGSGTPSSSYGISQWQQAQATQVSVLAGLNVKLMPAFYWGTMGIEVEYPITQKISAGLNFSGTLGRTDGANANFKIKPEAYLEEGFNVDVVGKYYIIGDAPEGFYAMFNVSYNSKLYFDGNTRPYTLHNRWKELNGLRVPSDLVKPKPFNTGVGAGYQLVVIPKHLIANVMLGIQGQQDANDEFFISIYLAPSIGYLF